MTVTTPVRVMTSPTMATTPAVKTSPIASTSPRIRVMTRPTGFRSKNAAGRRWT